MAGFIFKSANELFSMEVTRNPNKLRVKSSATNYRWVRQPWRMLFDKGVESFQEEQAKNLSDAQFWLAIQAAMQQVGYKLIRRYGETGRNS
jgi:hypothetical protein